MSGNEQKIIDLDKSRMQAMTAGDTATLKSLISDDLTYTHTSAAFDTKQSLIEKIESGNLKYTQMEPSDVSARDYGDTVILNGTASVQVVSGGRPLSFGLKFTDVYVNRGGNWQMVAWQSTRLPE